MAFRGHYDYSLDAKNRVNLPPKFRPAFSGGLVLQKWLEPCVAIWTPEGFEAFTDSFLPALNPVGPDRRKLTRFLINNSFDAELDAAGRVTLSQPLLEHAAIQKDVVVAGTGDHVEVWDRDRWLADQESLKPEVLRIAEGLGHPS